MRNKLLAVKIIAALGIPLFPLGARFFPPQGSVGGLAETGEAPQGIAETQAMAFEPEGSVKPEKPIEKTFPPVKAETLARVFSPPNKARAGEQPPRDGTAAQTQAVPGDGKFSYLGSIRESNGREWLYIKEEASGRVMSIDASLDSSNEAGCVVAIEGVSYFIRRK
jgi:hypothetical protein